MFSRITSKLIAIARVPGAAILGCAAILLCAPATATAAIAGDSQSAPTGVTPADIDWP